MQIQLSFDSFKKLSKKGNLVAISASIAADLETPVSTFLKTAHGLDHAFLLESAEQGEKVGRYSIIGLKPKLILQDVKGKLKLQGKAASKVKLPSSTPILKALEKILGIFKLANPEALPGFPGGLIGYLAYENVQSFEDITLKAKKSLGTPESIFFLSEELIIFDHYRKTLTFAILADVTKSSSKTIYEQTLTRIKALARKLEQPLKISERSKKKKALKLKSNMTPKQFHTKVKRIKEYIKSGDCIQVVLSQRFAIAGAHDDFQIYRALRSINPSPYMFYFKSKDFRLIGSSPEVLVKKTGRLAEVRPIAGTRPRGATSAQDQKYAENLKKSTKEMAEHLMLVDLGRNDLGRVCEFDSIQVKDYAHIEYFSHVMHLVSDVSGKLKKNKNAFELLGATFPAGTVSGAPKIRAMEIINELEPDERGPYAGCLGYFNFEGDMDMCITIRTLVAQKGKLFLQAGAGIVKDSNPEKEYEETCNKARALVKAIESQGAF